MQSLVELRNPSAERLQRGVVAFDLHVVHVEEGGAWGQPPQESAAASEAIGRSAQHGTEGHTIAFHAIGLEDVFCSSACGAEPGDNSRRRQQLADLVQAGSLAVRHGSFSSHVLASMMIMCRIGCHWAPGCRACLTLSLCSWCLLQAVRDKTGKEDLVASLRRALLLRRAAELGCNKVHSCPQTFSSVTLGFRSAFDSSLQPKPTHIECIAYRLRLAAAPLSWQRTS